MKRTASAGKSLAVVLVLVLAGTVAAAAGGEERTGELDGKALFEKKCSACHGLSWSTNRREWKPEWRQIVDRMVRKREGWISAKEAAAIVDYLASEYGRD